MRYGLPGRRVGSFAVVIVTGAMVVLPFLWILQTSFKRTIDISMGSLIFEPTLANFQNASGLVVNTRNSLVVASTTTFFVVLVGSLAAYSVARLGWPRWIPRLLLGWAIIFHALPTILFATPWYLLFLQFNLVDSLFGLTLAHITLNLPMVLWIMVGFFQEVPKEVEEAARVDGATHGQVFRKVALPLVVPGIVAAGALSFILSWNEFMVALTLTTTETATVPIGVARFAQQFETRLGEMAASSMLSMIPALLLVVIAQRFIIKGLTLGALK